MAITLIGSEKKGAPSGNADVTTDGFNTTGATLIVVAVGEYEGDSPGVVVTDSGTGNTWVPLTVVQSGTTTQRCQLFYTIPVDTDADHTFTASLASSNSTYLSVCVIAFAGTHPTAPFDQESGEDVVSATHSPGPLTPSEDGCVVVVFCSPETQPVNSIDDGFSLEQSLAATGNNVSSGIAYLIQTSAAVADPAFTIGASQGAASAMAVFKAAPTTIELVDSGSGGSPNGILDAVTGSLDTTGADFIVLAVGDYDGGISGSSTVNDSKSNTWTPLTLYTEGGVDSQIRFYYCNPPPAKTGGSHTFTAHFNDLGVFYGVIAAAAFSGVHASPFDQESGSEGTASTMKPGTLTPGFAGTLVVTAATVSTGANLSSIDEDMDIVENVASVGGQHLSLALAYIVQTAAEAIDPTWTLSSSGNVSTNMAVFKAAFEAGGSARRWRLTLLGVG